MQTLKWNCTREMAAELFSPHYNVIIIGFSSLAPTASQYSLTLSVSVHVLINVPQMSFVGGPQTPPLSYTLHL